MFWENHFQTIS